MPRYCAVKTCRNRGGTASKQENKRISFYPFPLRDKARLQRWVDNMKRDEWTPSRHQYLCSEHFTEDCFDIRWGIRYLKHSAIPTVFHLMPSIDEMKALTGKRSPKLQGHTCDTDTELVTSLLSANKKDLIVTPIAKVTQSACTNTSLTVSDGDRKTEQPPQRDPSELPLTSGTGVALSCLSPIEADLLENQSLICESPVHAGMWAVPGLSPPPGGAVQPEVGAGSTVTVLCCEPLGSFPDGEAAMDAAALQAALGQTLRIIPLELVKEDTGDCPLEEGAGDAEHGSVLEHSYCRPDTDTAQLWCKILSLHAKISELDNREESTLSKIRALETEIVHLKRDSAVFQEKQKVLEDCITSLLL